MPYHHSVSHIHKKVTEANEVTNSARFCNIRDQLCLFQILETKRATYVNIKN